MKFGRLIWHYSGKTYVDGSAIYNIGDNIQQFAVDYIYNLMGIDKSEIIDIDFSQMKYYDGEYVILPIIGYASHYKRFNQLPTSDKIIPLIVSFELSDENCDDIVPYLKKNEPIGCRDEATMKLLRRKGVEAYTSGCLSITLPRRKVTPKEKKLFLIDVPSSVEKYIPQELMKNYECTKHEGAIGHAPMTKEDCKKIDIYAKEILKKYNDEATLVVTSRLHAAAPCIALGIPVILTIDNIDSRFTWLDKLIPIYDCEHYHEIDWNPQSVDIEDLKKKIISAVIKRLQKLWNEKADIYDISSFWENRKKSNYNAKLQKRLEALKKQYNEKDKFSYIIWGAGVHGKLAYTMVQEHFINAELIAVVDNYMDGIMFGKPIIKPCDVYDKNFSYALVTTHLGRFEAVDILNAMGKKKHSEWCYFMSKDVPEDDE